VERHHGHLLYFWVDPAEQLIAVQLIHVAPTTGGLFQQRFRDLAYGALSVPDQRVPASTAAPVTIDAATLGTYAGTYTFSTISSRDKQEPAPGYLARQFGGLGIQVAMENGQAKVQQTIRDMPAAKAGLMSNDIVTHIDDEPVQRLTLSQVLEKMRGPVNTTVRLRIRRNGNGPIEVSIVRALVRVAAADLKVAVTDGKLMVGASGNLPILDFDLGASVAVTAISENEFFVEGGDHTRLAFERDKVGRPARLVLNPGPGQITGQRIN
jgi:C-terminal processing protease CtpA/Prc